MPEPGHWGGPDDNDDGVGDVWIEDGDAPTVRQPDPSKIVYDAEGNAAYWAYGKTGEPYLVRVPELNRAPQQERPSTALTYEQQVALRGVPSVSSSTSQSFSDPASLALQRQQLDEQIRGNLAQEARDSVTQAFNRDKLRIETESGDKNRAIETQRLVETTQSRIDTNARAREELQASIANVDRQIAAAAAQGEATRALTASEGMAGRNLSREEQAGRTAEGVANRNLTREGLARQDAQERARLGLERDAKIAEFSANPGDVGRLSAMLQRGGLSNISTALGNGETNITDRSLEPLASLLAPGPAAYNPQYETYTPNVKYETAPGPLTQAITKAAPVVAPAPAPTGSPAPAPQVFAQAPAGTGPTAQTGGVDPVLMALIRAASPAGSQGALPYAEDGAAIMGDDMGEMMDKPEGVSEGWLNKLMALVAELGLEPKAIAGERGKESGETVYADPGANVVIAPDKGKGAKGKPKMATGGIAGMAPGSPSLNDLMALARQFMQSTGQTALQRSGFGTAPTPVSLADPGTSRFVRTLGGATTATVKGIDPGAFAEELNRLVPQALQYGVGRRTR